MVDALTIFAWIVIAILFLAIAAAIIALGSLPGQIARKRNHPQATAINAASWIGLALGGIGWPIAFVWSFLNSGSMAPDATPNEDSTEIADLRTRITQLEAQVAALATEKKTS